MEEIFIQKEPEKFRKLMECIWERYYKWCSSDDFRYLWSAFLQSTIGLSAIAIFYQSITDMMMHDLIKEFYPVAHEDMADDNPYPDDTPPDLDFQDINSVRYIAGYTIRSVSKKVARSAELLKDELNICLTEMMQREDETEEHESENWMKAIDRGGLIHVGDVTYMLFLSMETELKKHLNADNATSSGGVKDKALYEILKNEDVLFYWEITSINWDNAVSTRLLHLLVEHWITIRGYSFASSFMEKYKQKTKKTTQKSMGIRKTIN
jgi:hypothetical protein